jgi:hypothetical protein
VAVPVAGHFKDENRGGIRWPKVGIMIGGGREDGGLEAASEFSFFGVGPIMSKCFISFIFWKGK